MNELEQLKKENAELLTKLSNLVSSKSCATCNNLGVIDYDDGFGGVCSSPCHCTNNPYSTYSVINSSKIQSLADIKTDAVIEAANNTLVHYSNGYCLHCEVLEYANKLKGES